MPQKGANFIVIYLLILLNSIKFLGLGYSPPGFYIDEAVGAAEVICLAQTGSDLASLKYPLFAQASALYTPAYLYGELVWTSIFGYQVAAFRSLLVFINILTVVFLYLWVQRKANKKTALYVAFAATIMPWSFQFARIAWDPPFAVLFLVVALYFSSFKKGAILAGIFLSFAAYSYPTMRITAIIFLILIPGIHIRQKIITGISFFVVSIPWILRMLDPIFMEHANSLAIWSNYFGMPYAHANIFRLTSIFIVQFVQHFSFNFLFLSGDASLRSSIQSFGILSWLDYLALIILIYLIAKKYFIKNYQPIFHSYQTQLLITGFIGIIAGVTPAALTVEGIPHALRAIAAWPFFALITGIVFSRLAQIMIGKRILVCTLIIGLSFYTLYIFHYFYFYPKKAEYAFQGGDSNSGLYQRLASGKATCQQVQIEYMTNKNPITKIDELIFFGDGGSGTQYIGRAWPNQEKWGRWSEGDWADIRLPMPLGKPQFLILTLRAPIFDGHPKQLVELWINGIYKETITLTKSEKNQLIISIPNNAMTREYIWVDFKIINPVRPKDYGLGDDNRLLGVGVESAIFKESM